MSLRVYKLATLLMVSSLFLTTSCTQDEGIGGNSHIKGILVEKYYNNDFTIFQYEEPAKDDDVFILYGDNKEIGDKTTTSFTGNFQFQYLWPGNYQLYYYSDDTTGFSNEKVEKAQNIILEKGQTTDLGTVYTYKALEWNEGFAKISGKIMLINYKNGSSYPNLEIKDVTPAQEQDVYITYNNADVYTDRVRTQPDGTFEFDHLLKGNYTIFVYSEDVITGKTSMVVKEAKVEITESDQSEVLEDIYIEKI